jgi:signal transduction histidine kinase
MFNMMRIRAKLAVTLAIPLLVLVGLSSFVVALSSQKADDAARRSQEIAEQVALASSALGPGGVVSAMQTERNSAILTMVGIDVDALGSGADGSLKSPAAARKDTDAAMAQFRARMADSTPTVQAIFGPTVAEFDKVAGFRQAVDTSTEKGLGTPISKQTYANYSGIVEALFDANSKVALSVDDSTLRNGALLIDLNAREREHGSNVISELAASKLPLSDAGDALRVGNEWTRETAIDEQMMRTAVGPYRPIVEKAFADPRLKTYKEAVRQLIRGESTNVGVLIGPISVDVWQVFAGLDRSIADQLSADAGALRTAAEQERADAEQLKGRVVFVGLLALIAATGVTYMAARSISRPLLRLARNAEDMAAHRLPGAVKHILETPAGEDVVVPELEPVPLGGGREVNEVAVALNSVQESAAGLAVEQALLRRNIADSFVNLGRRNQNLLSRQIDSITQMERDEADPDTLERLFALDHLATRMRRNAESLLLLGGLEPHRQWSAPVPLMQIIRGAMGEVEDYQRINIRDLDEALIKGSAAADVTHLVAELLENALRFSPPGRDVDVIGRAASGGYSLAIVDAGLGMSEEDLARSNTRLSGRESFTVAPSRYLGHYVVGIQAARLGINVRLLNSPGSGVTARIELGDALADAAAVPAAKAPVVPAPAAVEQPPVEELSAEDEAIEDALFDELLKTEPVGATPAPRHEFVQEAGSDRFVPPAPVPEPAAAVETADARADMTVSPTDAPPVTASGYKRRQRGANVPRTEVSLARGDNTPDESVQGAPENKADSVRNLLSGLQAGADRARAENPGAAPTQEDVRERS